jgi:hypothetical protein
MIFKILEEMKVVRKERDYNNYRTLLDALNDYLRNEIFNVPFNDVTDEIVDKVTLIIKSIDEELTYLYSLSIKALENKGYRDFKLISQSYNHMKAISAGLVRIHKPMQKIY